MTTRASAKPHRTYPPGPKGRALPLLGEYGRRQILARLTFGKFKIQLTAEEHAALSARAETYLRANGTLFGFALHLLGGAADV